MKEWDSEMGVKTVNQFCSPVYSVFCTSTSTVPTKLAPELGQVRITSQVGYEVHCGKRHLGQSAKTVSSV